MKFEYFMEISHSGKTLILEEAAKTLAQREDTRVVFIMALGETKYNCECSHDSNSC